MRITQKGQIANTEPYQKKRNKKERKPPHLKIQNSIKIMQLIKQKLSVRILNEDMDPIGQIAHQQHKPTGVESLRKNKKRQGKNDEVAEREG